jgi:predicted DsbA family dithiol-disulfide isomerase
MNDKINAPMAIIVAGILIGGAVLISGGVKPIEQSNDKSLAAKIGLNSKKQLACIEAGTYKDKVQADTESGDKAMSHLKDGRGTPYNVLVSRAGVKVEVSGAQPYEVFKAGIDILLAGTAVDQKNIDLDPVTSDDHIFGNKDAEVTIVEYTDMECPFCARVHPTMKKLVEDYDGKVNWVVRHYPLDAIHENARLKAEAAECAWEQGGDEAFFKYTDELFEMIAPTKPTFDTSAL